jgi:hypothetical protein
VAWALKTRSPHLWFMPLYSYLKTHTLCICIYVLVEYMHIVQKLYKVYASHSDVTRENNSSTVVELGKLSKYYSIVCLKWVNYILYKLCLNKEVFRKVEGNEG